MSKRTIALGILFALLALTLSGVSYALRSSAPSQPGSPQLRPNVPAANLPATTLPPAAQAAFQSIISPAAAARFGITPASYRQARSVASTSAGTLYLIPGAKGACLFLAYGVSCGDPGAVDQPLLALLVKPLSSNSLVGGGITSAAATTVTASVAGGAPQHFDSRDGTFNVNEAAGLTAGDKIDLATSGN
jgi:hypothetical protein